MGEDRQQLTVILQRAEWALAENLLPFWARHAWDAEYGGFLTRLDRCGNRLDDREKILMMQVRLIHSFAAAHRHGLRNYPYLELAGKGFDFLVANMWDHKDGGFHYSVTRDGRPLCLRKNTDFHGYALTGLSEYYLASGRDEALGWAEKVFDVLMAKAADRDVGFMEDFDGRDWDVLNAEQMNLTGRRNIKTIDMHTNVLEGLLYLCKASGKPAHADALRGLLRLVCRRGIDSVNGCTVTAFDGDWNPVPDAFGNHTTSYGLNVELAWILQESAELLNIDDGTIGACVLGLIDHALAFGFDHERGGLAACGPMSGSVLDAVGLPEGRLLKSWWAQAEMLNALCVAWRLSPRRDYLDAFVKLFAWIDAHQIDHVCGDWYQDTRWDSGAPVTTDKGNEYKTAFHAGRALIRTIDAVRRALAKE